MNGKSMTLDAVDSLFEQFCVAYDPSRLKGGRLPFLLRFRRYLEEAGLTELAAAESAAWCRQRELLELAYQEAIMPPAFEGGCGGEEDLRAPLFRTGCAACMEKGGCSP
ncbi:nitrogenase-stabilizing/protective protein NifW [Gorillibacterium massiliense]|uniref:nitrogenase-stabilizing/protective protein NifW n=1 Tax=Gorillibacterium massiliense TaxID=1280390 RepID=UPI0004BAE555|nr:nitrogenase-stabilizing/protective protein NifW [Gorillibacterium massiliense]